jgi:nucleoporin GLE1
MAVRALRGVAHASDGSDSDSDDDMLFGVVVGSGGGVSQPRDSGGGAKDGFHAREARVSAWGGACVIRAPVDSDDSDDSDEDSAEFDAETRQFGSASRASDALRSPLGDTEHSAAAPMGAGGLQAVSRARAVSHQRDAARRAAARAAADRRKEALELELHWALQAEAEERAAVAATAKEIAEGWVAAEAAAAAEAEREELAALDELDARWGRDAAAVEAVLRADAAAAAAAAKAKTEAEAAARAAAAAKAKAVLEAEEAEKRRLEEAASAAAAAEARAKTESETASRAVDALKLRVGSGNASSSSKSTPGSVPKIYASIEAIAAEGEFAAALRAARAEVAEYASGAEFKKDRRWTNTRITVHVQQIAATRKQIEQKALDLCQFLRSMPDDARRTFACLSLAKRVLTQCDCQVSKLNRFAFALAETSVRIAVFEPRFGTLLIALLHESCILAVPKYYPFVEGRYVSDAEYFESMGYVAHEDQTGVGQGDPLRLESTDAFCSRVRGFMLFYAAYAQVDHAKHPHGLPFAWSWVARLLNKVPPNRFSATALEAFLKHAGFAMHRAYGVQFGKMLDVVFSSFLPELVEKDDPDARPVVNRTLTYLNERGFLKSPEGKDMPLTDTSSTTRIS